MLGLDMQDIYSLAPAGVTLANRHPNFSASRTHLPLPFEELRRYAPEFFPGGLVPYLNAAS